MVVSRHRYIFQMFPLNQLTYCGWCVACHWIKCSGQPYAECIQSNNWLLMMTQMS